MIAIVITAKNNLLSALFVLFDQRLGVFAGVDGRRVEFPPLQMKLWRLFMRDAGWFHLGGHLVNSTTTGAVRGTRTTVQIYRVVHGITEVAVLVTHLTKIIFHVQRFLEQKT